MTRVGREAEHGLLRLAQRVVEPGGMLSGVWSAEGCCVVGIEGEHGQLREGREEAHGGRSTYGAGPSGSGDRASLKSVRRSSGGNVF